MGKKRFRNVMAAVCAIMLLLGLAPAAYAAEEPAKSSNINRQNYDTYYASTVKSYLYENERGGLTRVEYIDGTIVVEDYDSSFTLRSSRTIPMELSVWGGFFAGEEYNFFVFGQNNPNESDSVEVFRIVKYSKDWQRLGQASLSGANTETPFRSGSLRCAEYGGYLYIRTCHRMYKSSKDGLNHQANVMIAVRENDMTITDSYYDVMNTSYGYVSHSFNQFIIVDTEGKIVALDHGDAYPRGIAFSKYYADAGTGKFSGTGYGAWCSAGTMLEFAGAVGQNATGASVGGLAETTSHYIFAYNYDGAGGNGERYVYFHYMDKATGKSWSAKITTTPGATTPVLAPAGLNGGYMLWNGKSGGKINDTLYYIAYNASGTPSVVVSDTGSLSDCQPIYYNGQAVWYVTDNSAPVFYTLDASGVQSHPTGGGTAPAAPAPSADPGTTTTTTPAPAAPSTPAAPAAGGSFPDLSGSHWAYADVQQCVKLGIVAGYEDGTFRPDGSVTTAEFITMMCRTFYGDELAKNSSDSRFSGYEWYAPAMYTGAKILAGTSNMGGELVNYGKSFYNVKLSRYDMAQVLYNTLAANGKTASASQQAAARAEIKDWSKVPGNYQTAVTNCYALGILNGMNGGNFSGEQTMTRAQACIVISRMLSTISASSGGSVPENDANTGGQTGASAGSTPQSQIPVSLKMDPASLTLTAGQTGSVRASVSGTTSAPSISYTSSNENVAAVSSSGTVTAKGAGTASITAAMTWEGTRYTAVCAVTVNAPIVSQTPEEMRAEVVRLVNEERAKEGLPPLGTFDSLSAAAQVRAPEIVTLFEHTRPDGRECFTALKEAGVSYYTAGENIAAGQSTPAAVVESWMNSPGHRANILNKDFTHIGVGYVKSGSGYGSYWVQMFVGTGSAPASSANTGSTGSEGGSVETGAGSNNASGAGSGGAVVDMGGYYRSELPESGRTTHYREEGYDGSYLDVQVLNGNTVQFSGCKELKAGLYNYAVLQAYSYGGTGYTPFVSGVPFSTSVQVDVAKLLQIYGGDTSKATSYLTCMICQNYQPGDSGMAGDSFHSSIYIALTGDGGVELQVVPR